MRADVASRRCYPATQRDDVLVAREAAPQGRLSAFGRAVARYSAQSAYAVTVQEPTVLLTSTAFTVHAVDEDG